MGSNDIVYKITEEITRFAFEVHIKERSQDWIVLFTNPTAGPWKKILYKDGNQTIEIGRYGREEKRPDLILLHKKTVVCIIVEAKDDPSKILKQDQLIKSCEVFLKEQKRLSEHKALKDSLEGDLLFLNSFLWYDTGADNLDLIKDAFFKLSKNSSPLLCIVNMKKGNNLICHGKVFYSSKSDIDPKIDNAIQDLKLNRLS